MVTSHNDGHGALRGNMSHGVGNLVETLFDVGRNSEDVTDIAESLNQK